MRARALDRRDVSAVYANERIVAEFNAPLSDGRE